MSSKTSTSLRELKSLREAVLADEKAKTKALLQRLPPNTPPLAEEAPLLDETSSSADDLADLPADDLQAVDHEGSTLPDAAESLALAPESFPEIPKTFAPRPAPTNRPRPAPKDATLIIPLTPKIQERLERNTEGARWSAAQLVMELIRASLHKGYPAIHFEDLLLARPGTYRTLERSPIEGDLKILSGQGAFTVSARLDCADYQNWLSYFTAQNVPNPEHSASQACLFALQNYLEGFEDFRINGWAKRISSEAYSVSSLT